MSNHGFTFMMHLLEAAIQLSMASPANFYFREVTVRVLVLYISIIITQRFLIVIQVRVVVYT